MKKFSVALFVLTVVAMASTSCTDRQIRMNGAVKVEFVEAPETNKSISLGNNEELAVNLEARRDDIKIGKVSVSLFVQDASAFVVSNDGSFTLKEGKTLIGAPESDDDYLFNNETEVNDVSYDVVERVDFSSYEEGTIFGLVVSYENSYSGGITSDSRYFRKSN